MIFSNIGLGVSSGLLLLGTGSGGVPFQAWIPAYCLPSVLAGRARLVKD